MSMKFRGHPATAHCEDIDPVLLAETQAYLEARRRGLSPDPRLTQAWGRFYLACTPLIRRCVGAYPMTEEDRRDCVQETWTEIIAGLHKFQRDPSRGRLRTWLYALARNKAVDVIRRRRRHPTEHLGDVRDASLPDHGIDPSAEYERRRTRSAVLGMLDRLSGQVSPCSFRVLYLRWIEGRSVPEIAVALGLTPEQVHLRHHRVMRKLRRQVERSGRLTPDFSEWG